MRVRGDRVGEGDGSDVEGVAVLAFVFAMGAAIVLEGAVVIGEGNPLVV